MGIPQVGISQLPPEVQTTVNLIAKGGHSLTLKMALNSKTVKDYYRHNLQDTTESIQ